MVELKMRTFHLQSSWPRVQCATRQFVMIIIFTNDYLEMAVV